MAADYSKRVQSADKHLSNITSSRFAHIDGSKAQTVVRPGAGRLLNVVICTKGIAFVVRNGPTIIGSFATTSPEGTYDFGVYFNTNLTVDVASGTGSVNINFDE